MNLWHDMAPERIQPHDFLAIIEISKGSKNKYELDKDTGMLFLDRILYTSTHYPANYGFISLTYAEDNDPLDVLVLCNEPIIPLSLCRCYPIGMVRMIDEGFIDNKVIAIPFREPSLNTYTDISELPPHVINEIGHFFTVYKALEEKQTAVIEIVGRGEALKTIADNRAEYKRRFVSREKR